MEKNVGGTDRWVRWGVGGGLLLIGLRSSGFKRWLAMTAGAKVLGTAAVQKCAINEMLGVNTYAAESQPALTNP